MTIAAIDLILAGVDVVPEKDGLAGSVEARRVANLRGFKRWGRGLLGAERACPPEDGDDDARCDAEGPPLVDGHRPVAPPMWPLQVPRAKVARARGS